MAIRFLDTIPQQTQTKPKQEEQKSPLMSISDRNSMIQEFKALMEKMSGNIEMEAMDRMVKMMGNLVQTVEDLSSTVKQILDKETPEYDYARPLDVNVLNQKTVKIPEFPTIKIPDAVTVSNLPVDRTDEILLALKDGFAKLSEAMVRSDVPQKPDDAIEAPATLQNAGTGSASGKRKFPKLIPETPTGTIDGVNAKFFMSRQPKWGTQAFLFLNSAYQTPGTDFTWSGNQISYTNAPPSQSGHYVLFLQ